MLTRNPQVHFSSILTVQNAGKFSEPFSSHTHLNVIVLHFGAVFRKKPGNFG